MTSEHKHRCLHNTSTKPTYTQHMFAVSAFFYLELDYCES